jgi:hypothetical protein
MRDANSDLERQSLDFDHRGEVAVNCYKRDQ